MTPMKDRIDKMERYSYIDGVTWIARNPKRAGELDVPVLLAKLLAQAIDWDETLRYGNGWYDRMAAALDKPTYAMQKETLRALNDELSDVGKDVKSGKRIAALLLTFGEKRRKLLGKTMGEVLVLLLMPAVSAASEAEVRHRAQRQLVAASFALAAYKSEHGKYPDKLAKLLPEILKELPQDAFSGGTVKYTSDGEDYVIYSVGPNLVDDGGFGRQDEAPADVDGDDIAIRSRRQEEPHDE